MSSISHAVFIDERVAKLELITERRNELLREMYHLLQQRKNVALAFARDLEDTEELDTFLEKFHLEQFPQSGTINSFELSEFEEEEEEEGSDEEANETVAEILDQPTTPEKLEYRSPQHASMDVDVPDSPFPSPTRSRRTPARHHATNESDEILAFLPESKSSWSRKGSTSSVKEKSEAGSERDELDLIGPLSPSVSRSPSPSIRNRKRLSRSRQAPKIRASSEDQDVISIEEDPVVTDAPSSPTSRTSPETPPDTVAAPRSPLPKVSETPVAHVIDSEFDNVDPPHPSSKPQFTGRPSDLVPHQDGVKSMDLVAKPVSSLILHAPSIPISKLAEFNFRVGKDDMEVDISDTVSPLQVIHHFDPHYTLPPLKLLPPEFHRRGKLTKQQRKREKERERGERGADGKKDEWVPMGINKWGATVIANPVWKKVSRANKCLSTREWSVAMSELRLIRTLERVEALKEAGRWSFRQPKKQRSVGGLIKSHWDYVMDEMKWMRLDFREERKWKIAIAYNLGTAVLEWHAAKTLGERVRRGISVLWKRPRDAPTLAPTTEQPDGENPLMEVDQSPAEESEPEDNPLPMVNYGSDEDDEAEGEQQDVADALEASNALEEAFQLAEENSLLDSQRGNSGDDALTPKVEDFDDISALQQTQSFQATDVDSVQTNNPELLAKQEESKVSMGLKPGSTDPVLIFNSGSSSQTQSLVADGESLAQMKSSKANPYAPLREKIAFSDDLQLFLDFDDADLVQSLSDLNTDDKPPLPPPDLSLVFPDLQPFGMLSVAPPLFESKKKSEKRDDPNRRTEDTTYAKLTPIGKFMQCKPTLLGAVNPAKRWVNGDWTHLDDVVITAEFDHSNRTGDVILSELFEGSKSANSPPQGVLAMVQALKESRKRVNEHIWTASDDAVLKSIADRYPHNWALIADVFNSGRVSIVTDKRTALDCFDRWSQRFSSGIRPTGVDNIAASPSVGQGSQQMTTRGIKRLASNMNGTGSVSGGDGKKKKRHTLLLETIRKTSRKREAAQRTAATQQRKPSAIHDTHGQYNKMQKLGPAELSRMKAEKESRDQQELLHRKRTEELTRQQMIQAQRAQALPIAQQPAQAQAQASPSAVPRAPGQPPVPPQVVPQIRNQVNISQQQRIPNGSSPARLSPQQQQQLLQAQAAAHARVLAMSQQNQGSNGQPNGASGTSGQYGAVGAGVNGGEVAMQVSSPMQGRAAGHANGHFLGGAVQALAGAQLTPDQMQTLRLQQNLQSFLQAQQQHQGGA